MLKNKLTKAALRIIKHSENIMNLKELGQGTVVNINTFHYILHILYSHYF